MSVRAGSMASSSAGQMIESVNADTIQHEQRDNARDERRARIFGPSCTSAQMTPSIGDNITVRTNIFPSGRRARHGARSRRRRKNPSARVSRSDAWRAPRRRNPPCRRRVRPHSRYRRACRWRRGRGYRARRPECPAALSALPSGWMLELCAEEPWMAMTTSGGVGRGLRRPDAERDRRAVAYRKLFRPVANR